MPKPRKTSLETPTARLKLPIRKKPYWLRLGPGLSLGYRRNETAGSLSVRAADGQGGEWLKKFGIADDYEPADGKRVFSFSQAIDAARKLVRGGDDKPADQSKPVTLDGALDAYKDDLTARQAHSYNARWPRKHLTAALLSKPVTLLDSHELRKWRDGLLAKMAPATVNRLIGNVCAALNLAAEHDRRIKNSQAWEIGLQGLPDAQGARNVILNDDQVRAIVTTAYARCAKLGLFMDVLAVTGTRPSQAARLTVGDLDAHRTEPKLQMPKSGKGGGRNRAANKALRYSVPITVALAQKLKEAAKGRATDAPLLTQVDGTGWSNEPSQLYRVDVRAIVGGLGLDPNEITAYSLRHSSIVRGLLLNVPVRVVAALHDTSVAMIEANYSKFIAEHSDAIARAALLHNDAAAPPADNVMPIGGR